MTPKPEALKYLEQRIRNDKQFSVSMLAELIFKNCKPEKLEKAVKEWKTLNLDKASKQAKVEKPNSQAPVREQNDWDDL